MTHAEYYDNERDNAITVQLTQLVIVPRKIMVTGTFRYSTCDAGKY